MKKVLDPHEELKRFIQQEIDLGQKIDRIIEFTVSRLLRWNDSDRRRDIIKLRAIVEMGYLPFETAIQLIKEKVEKPNNYDEPLRCAFVSAGMATYTFSQLFKLAGMKCRPLQLLGENTPVETMTREQLQEIADLVYEKRDEDKHYGLGCFYQGVAKKIQWVKILRESSLEIVLQLCDKISGSSGDLFVWNSCLGSIWNLLTQEQQDKIAEQHDYYVVWETILNRQGLGNERIVAICEKQQNHGLWQLAAKKLDVKQLSTEEIVAITKRMKPNARPHDFLTIVAERKFGDKIGIEEINALKDPELLKAWLQKSSQPISDILGVNKCVLKKTNWATILSYIRLDIQQAKTLVARGIISWQEISETAQSLRVRVYAITQLQDYELSIINKFICKLLQENPNRRDLMFIIKLLSKWAEEEDCQYNLLDAMRRIVPWDDYTPKQIVATYEAFGKTGNFLVEEVIDALAKKIAQSEKEEEEQKQRRKKRR